MNVTPSREDYLIAVYLLKLEKEEVRSVDVAEFLGYTKPSVSNGLRYLREHNLLEMDSRKFLFLTPSGRVQAEQIYTRYQTVLQFLTQVLGVSEDVARRDTCKIEHLVSRETVERMNRFLG